MPNMKDVARYAGVSVTTVSRVVNDYPHVDAGVRERVLNAAAVLGYRANAVARSMRQGRTRSLGLIVRDMASTNFAAICAAAEAAAERRGYQLFVCNSNRDPKKERRYIEALLNRRVDGLVIFTADDRVNNLDLTVGGPPVVLVESELSIAADRVMSGGEEAAAQATRHLLGLGHRRIAFMAWGQGIHVGKGRLNGFMRAMAEAGIAPDVALIRHCGVDPTRSEPETRFVLTLRPAPTALLISATDLTPGALSAIRELQIEVPRDLSVLAFDDREAASFFAPPITVMARNAADLGSKAVELLLDRIEGRLTQDEETRVVPFSLLVRGSTGPCRTSDVPAGGRS